jgi:hypothetical protein
MSKADISTTPIRSRRAVLTGMAAAAALPIAVALPATVPAFAIAPDPIFAAMDEYRHAHALFFADTPGDIPDEIRDRHHDACRLVRRTRPTTPAGLAILTTWAREQADWLKANGSYLIEEECCALAATIDDATRGMCGLEPWSPPSAVAAASTPDPAYDVIERHQRLSIAYDKAVNHPDVGDERPQFAAVNEISDRAFDALLTHSETMFAMQPSSPGGVAALLGYISTIEAWQMPNDFGETTREMKTFKELCRNVATAIEAFAGKAVQS